MVENNENMELEAVETQEELLESASPEKATPKKQTAVAKGKKQPEKKPNFFVRLGKGLARWFRELKGEAKKVVWPTGKQIVNNTIIVIIAVLIVSVFVYVLDVAFGTIRDFIVQLI